ncbi:MAG: methyltransferase domain-containing protein [Planctomycetaceae bacterium]
MLKSVRNHLEFFRQFRQRFETTGSIAPSSRFLAQGLTRFLAQRTDQPVRVLEVGPGTGPATDRIVRLLRPGDHFDLVELNESFVDILNQRFETETAWHQVRDLSRIHQMPLQDFQPTEKYDFIVSGLPHVNFPAEVVELITDRYFELLKPGGMLSYFEYMFIRPIRKVVTFGAARERILRISDIVDGHAERCRICRDNVWLNLPPAWVHHLRMPGDES